MTETFRKKTLAEICEEVGKVRFNRWLHEAIRTYKETTPVQELIEYPLMEFTREYLEIFRRGLYCGV